MSRHRLIVILGVVAILGWAGFQSVQFHAAPGGGQNPSPQAGGNPPTVIKTETNLVLVDVVATDKKGNYLRDLEQKDFHVFEDDAEQTVTTFSRAADIKPDSPERKRYIVLFFDDSTMAPADQGRAREAAAKFVESTASPDRLMAVVDFGGNLRIGQNFTADSDLLKRAVGGVKFSAVQPNNPASEVQLASMGVPSLGRTQSDYGARSMLLSIRELAKTLRTVPGRKTLVLFSGGFALTGERQVELTATIDALNKSNIAVYPMDVRGLATSPNPGMMNPTSPMGRPGFSPGSFLKDMDSPFPHQAALLAALMMPLEPDPQRGGAGGGGGVVGGGGGGGAGGAGGVGAGGAGGRGGTTSPASGAGGNPVATPGAGNPNTNPNNTNNPNNPNNPNNNPALNPNICNGPMAYQYPSCGTRGGLIPIMPDSVATNQQVLFALASGTGGFTIFNTNDFLAGLGKIAKEMNEYYVLGYVPPNQAHDGSYHKIKVRVERKGVDIRARNGYFDAKSPDLLAGKPEGKALEERVASAQPGEIPVALSAPYFYTSPGVARVNLSLSIPGSSVDFEKDKGNFHSKVNVLGIAYRENGSVSARFSDTVKLDYEKKDLKDFAKSSFDYQNSFNIAPGKYTLKLVLSAGGQKFGKYEMPLVVDPFSGNELALGGPALSAKLVPVSGLTAGMDEALIEDRTPLVFRGVQIVPSTNNRFAKGAKPIFYVEVFDPLLQTEAPRVGILYNIIDKKTNQAVFSSNTVLINQFVLSGSPLVPVGVDLPVAQLQAGDYRLEVRGRDSAGNASLVRTAEFTVE
jgi:VWFA-related protein